MDDISKLKGTTVDIADLPDDLTEREVETIAAMERLLDQGAIKWTGEMRRSARTGRPEKVFVAAEFAPADAVIQSRIDALRRSKAKH
jgi:hypothetical protein